MGGPGREKMRDAPAKETAGTGQGCLQPGQEKEQHFPLAAMVLHGSRISIRTFMGLLETNQAQGCAQKLVWEVTYVDCGKTTLFIAALWSTLRTTILGCFLLQGRRE